MYVDALDSYYQYVKARILAVNPSRVIKGMMDAQDWPAKNVVFDAFYLLDIGDIPVGKQFYSAQTPVLFKQVQWVWINKGTDLTQGIRQANRGDRFRTFEAMKGELLNASFPGYCPKSTYALDGNGNWIGTPLATGECLLWKPIEFHKKSDRDSGLIYASAATRLVDMTDPILA